MSSVGDELIRERAAFRDTLVAMGPDVPTACGSWTTSDLAVHVVMGELAAGLPSYPGRFLVGCGVRVDFLASSNASMLARQRRRHDFDWAVGRLRRDPPRAQRRGRIGAVSLLEVWAHHQDVLASASRPLPASLPCLETVVPILVRYQRRPLEQHRIAVETPDRTWFEPHSGAQVRVNGSDPDICRWLSGRGGLDGVDVTGYQDVRDRIEDLQLAI